MDKMIKVEYNDKIYEYPVETELKDVAELFQYEFAYPILAGRVDNQIKELNYKLEKKCKVK